MSKKRMPNNPLELIAKGKKKIEKHQSETIPRRKITIKDFPEELHKKMLKIKIERSCNVTDIYEEAVKFYLNHIENEYV